jgi:hypothetical protein
MKGSSKGKSKVLSTKAAPPGVAKGGGTSGGSMKGGGRMPNLPSSNRSKVK